MNSGVQAYLDYLEEKHKEAIDAAKKFAARLALADRQNKVQAGEALLESLRILDKSLSTKQQPIWLPKMQTVVQLFIRQAESTEASEALVTGFPPLMLQMFAQKWRAIAEDDDSINLTDIANKAYEATSFPDLFESLASQIEAVLASGEIDSNSAINRLRSLIKLIRKNSGKSWASAQYMVPFTLFLLKNTFTEYGAKALGPLGKAIEKTTKQMSEEWSVTQSQVFGEIAEAIKSLSPKVVYLPPVEEVDVSGLVEVMQIEPCRIEYNPDVIEGEVVAPVTQKDSLDNGDESTGKEKRSGPFSVL